jgi:hypothetical protein
MTLLPSEEIIKFSFNLPPEAFDSMKIDMRLFGSRTRRALKTDLRSRLDEKRKNQQVEIVLKMLLEGLNEYKSAIYSNFNEYKSDSGHFNAEKNITAFWHLMNSFLLDLVERPEDIDSVILEKPVQDILSPYFEEIGYLTEFYIHSLFSSWFPYFTVTVAKLLSRQKINETLFGYPLNYTIEHINSLKPSIIFGVSSFFDPKNTKIRIDHSMADVSVDVSFSSLMNQEKEFVETVTQKPYNETVFEFITFHEKVHYLFHLVKHEHYPEQYNDPSSSFNYLVLSEVWARLVTLFLSNGALIYDLSCLRELKEDRDPVYYGTYIFLKRYTSIYEIYNKIYLPLNSLIFECRTLALESIEKTANWMNNYFHHENEKKWNDIIKLMKQEYNIGESAYPSLDKEYRPKLRMMN